VKLQPQLFSGIYLKNQGRSIMLIPFFPFSALENGTRNYPAGKN